MQRLRIGVWTQKTHNPKDGGGFGYYSELIDCISKTKFTNADICFLGNHTFSNIIIGDYKYHSIKWKQPKKGILSRFIYVFGTKFFHINSIVNYYQKLDKQLNDTLISELHNICDIIYYPTPMCKYQNFPFIYTLWDLGHLTSYALPEFNNDGNFEERKFNHDIVPYKALMIFCESETGKNDAIHYLRLNCERIRVLPLFPSRVISEKLTPSKPQNIDSDWIFIHYPAQYWSHKNHYNLICAFSLVLEKHPNLKLLLTGSDQGNKTYILNTISDLKLKESVIDLGFVDLDELKWLYIHSKGLIMPTLLGPTNMPPLEALILGCPIAVSNLPGHKEQFGDNAIYFNPLDSTDIKTAIENLITDNFKFKFMEIPTAQSNMNLLDNYFGELKAIRQTWA